MTDLVVTIAGTYLAWRLVIRPLLERWKSVRGITGIRFVPKRED